MGRERTADAHSSDYVAALLPSLRGEDTLCLRIHATAPRRVQQVLAVLRSYFPGEDAMPTAAASAAAPMVE